MVLHPVESILKVEGDDLRNFLEEVITHAYESGINLDSLEIDHVCYRCESKAQYKQVCSAIASDNVGHILIENMIGGRPITIIKFTEPINYKQWQVLCLELTCPKPGRVHKHGFEHLEVVIDPLNEHGFKDSRGFLETFAAKYPNIQFDVKAIHKDINADLSLTTPAGNSVKFHARPIYEVCEYELSTAHYEPIPKSYFDDV